MKKKMNNKGFSLVELIVVMAIMAILAVTLAPKLTHYIDKAKQTGDREVVNAIYTAAKYALNDSNLYDEAFSLDTTIDANGSADISDGTGIILVDPTALAADTKDMYTVINSASGSDTWTMNSTYEGASNKFIKEIYAVVGNFKLRSTLADADTTIRITATSVDTLKVELFYTYAVAGTNTADYTVDEVTVR